MARRKRNEGLLETFIYLSWKASIITGAAVFIGMYCLLPSFLSGRPLLAELAATSRSYAWLPIALFGMTALLSFLRSRAPSSRLPHLFAMPGSLKTAKETQEASPETRLIFADPEWALSADSVENPGRIVRKIDGWTVGALRELEWKRFELVCAKYYELVGFKSQTLYSGPDGGIDIKLYKSDPAKPIAIVQCKAWNTRDVEVSQIRELLGVMASEKVARGIFITTGSYTQYARAFGADNPMQLLDGPAFIKKIRELPRDQQEALLQFAFDGDYRTPTCASCGIKMAMRDGKRGPFWGCINYPHCKSTFNTNQSVKEEIY